MKNRCLLLISSFLLTLTACGGRTTPSEPKSEPKDSEPAQSEPVDSEPAEGSEEVDEIYDVNDPDYYDNVTKRTSFDEENELNIREDFTGGMNDDVWYCLEGSWHTTDPAAPHNGVKKRNLFYTTDSTGNSYLAIRARGYYDTTEGLPEGGCIETQNHLTPGRYEITMAAMPREGGVSAMWTYCTTTGSEATSQNEIDIEIGGTTGGTQFENEWCTSWTKKTDKQTDAVNVTDLLYMNDGRMHKYSFDWYTSYGEEREARVDWFIYEHYITSISGTMVPDHSMPLWIGVWFPPLWAGSAAFENDYMIIDRIDFTAFTYTQYYDNCRTNTSYNPTKPSETNIQTVDFDSITKDLNKFANGGFESLDKSVRDDSYYGWVLDAPDKYKGTVSLSDEHTEGNHSYLLSASNDEKDNGVYLGQAISNSYQGYKYRLKVDAKKMSDDAEGNIEICFKKSAVANIKTVRHAIESTTFETYEYEFEMLENAKYLKVYLTAENGSILYDNAQIYRIID